MMMQMDKMRELKVEISQMGSSSHAMVESLSSTLKHLSQLEEDFQGLKQDTNRLQSMNQEMSNNIARIENATKRVAI